MPEGYHFQQVQYRWDSDNGKYSWAHANNVGPTICNDHIYVHRSNAVIALGTGSAGVTLPAAETVAATPAPSRSMATVEELPYQEIE